MILTIKPFGTVDPTVLERLREDLGTMGQVVVSSAEPVPESFLHRKRDGQIQYLASEFEKAAAEEHGDRVLAVTDVDLFEQGLSFVFGHATIRDRCAVISIARFGSDGRERLFDRTTKTAIHELGHTFGLYHDEMNPSCVMYFSEKLEDTDRKGRSFCSKCSSYATVTLSLLRK